MKRITFILLGCVMLAACTDPYTPTARPDYSIRVVPSNHGSVAVPPACENWTTSVTDPYDNQPLPQFGCANARNLALMVERPDDLVKGRDLGPANGVTAAGAVYRYDANEPRGLMWTGQDPNQVGNTTAPTPASKITGLVQSGSSSSAAPAATQ
jgi:hypothetical protein